MHACAGSEYPNFLVAIYVNLKALFVSNFRLTYCMKKEHEIESCHNNVLRNVNLKGSLLVYIHTIHTVNTTRRNKLA